MSQHDPHPHPHTNTQPQIAQARPQTAHAALIHTHALQRPVPLKSHDAGECDYSCNGSYGGSKH